MLKSVVGQKTYKISKKVTASFGDCQNMLTRDEVLITLRSRKSELHERFGVNRIGLFGSYARGDATESSDIDIIVDLDRKDIFIRLDLKEYLQEIFGREVDIGYFETLRKLIRDSAKENLVYV